MNSNIRQLTDQVVVWALLKALSSHTSSIWISAKLNFSAILVITGKVYRALNSEIQSIVTKSTFLFWKPFVTLDDAAMTMWFETTHSHHHRRRIYSEGRRCCLGIQFTRCAIQSLFCTMQDDLKNRTNSSFSSYYPSAINPFFHIILVHTGSVARNWLNYVLQTTFVFFFCINSSCMATFVLYEYSKLDTFIFSHLFIIRCYSIITITYSSDMNGCYRHFIIVIQYSRRVFLSVFDFDIFLCKPLILKLEIFVYLKAV